jgi:hypothetical protein
MAEYITADHIAGQDGRFEPQRQNNFTLRVTPPGGGGGGGERILALSINAFPFPELATDEIRVDFGNEQRWVAAKTVPSDETFTFKDYVDGEVANIINEWHKKVYNPENGQIGYAKDYKVEADLVFFDPKGEKPRVWKLIGIWPKNVKFGEGKMESPGHNLITAVFRVDKVKYEGVQG